MKDNTITTADGIEVYTSQITEIADRYISDLEDKESIYDYTVFTDMLLSISDNMTPLNNYNDITVSGDGIYAEYTYNGDKQELYEDVYGKITNTCYTEE